MPQEKLEAFSTSPVQLTFRIRGRGFGNGVVKEVGLRSRDQEGAFREIEDLFSRGSFEGNEGIFSLAKHTWDGLIRKGATTTIKEMPLIIMEIKAYSWMVVEGGDFIEVPN